MKKTRGILLALAGTLLLSTQALAVHYSFQTDAPADYYGDTSYEEIYGGQYNYGGMNAVDLLDPLSEEVPAAYGGDFLEYGLSGSGGYYAGGAAASLPVAWTDTPPLTAARFTDASTMTRSDGSIGTLVIPKLGIRYSAYDGTDANAMRKGVGHFPESSAWDGNICFCGHNRGSSHNIGSIKDLAVGDVIQYETIYGTRTYAVSYVGVIERTDWSLLSAASDNRVTIITCLADQPEKRVCVQGVEVSS